MGTVIATQFPCQLNSRNQIATSFVSDYVYLPIRQAGETDGLVKRVNQTKNLYILGLPAKLHAKEVEKKDLTYLHCQAVYKICTLNEAVEHVILLVPEIQKEKLIRFQQMGFFHS